MAENATPPAGAGDATTPSGRYRMPRLMAAGAMLLSAAATYLLVGSDRWGRSGRRLPASFQLDLSDHIRIDPALIRFEQSEEFALALNQPRALTTGPNDDIFVAGDRGVHVHDAAGARRAVIELEAEPLCLAVGRATHAQPGWLYAATSRGIEVFDADRQRQASWPLPVEASVITAIALSDQDVFLADAASRLIWRLDTTGRVLRQIGKPDPARRVPGFVIPSQYFDVAIGSEGLLFAVNPGQLQIAAFTFDGDFGRGWGHAGSRLADFFGCCNPAHIALLPDGRFVTSEKGIPRIKVYTAGGDFESVVAGPPELGIPAQSVGDPRSGLDEIVFDVATDSRGRVLVLDVRQRGVRIFVPREG